MEQLKARFEQSGALRLAEALRGGRLHHAYIIEGAHEEIAPALADFFERELGVKTRGNPDYQCAVFDTFGIEEVRGLKERQSRLSVAGGKKVFVICAERIPVEAQNALLKTLEEPSAGTHFFFIIPSVAHILPTVRSRAVMLHTKGDTEDAVADAFFAASYAKREALIKTIVEEKDRRAAGALVAGLMRGLKKRYGAKDVAEYHAALAALHKCRGHLAGRAPSVKMLLEYLALVV
ncbi:hypothetical protein A3A38_02180 [Candidatus Kaiserbacteria bacterium RIFCSPLOWO2_01_FULL_53_17]|uniref:DNA polymerase III subunit delta n=1 Tax=Candidatus Kaiserbacteria bacterium RIFCSPLOWO2_01_FULL_53_17 TaxID=1798511 RepID=A0A1F6EFP0_9BACT|nr:MAG: hypothetical protein A3A38_02180 [Candidatus Kaiserbacteria bacterium RIFCSPLOWO2_01_FULL_53_17]